MLNRTFGEKKSEKEYRDREGAYAVILENDSTAVLVEAPAARSPQMGLFLIGGGIEAGETPEACIQRECLEEIGCCVDVGEELCCGDEYLYAPSTGDWLHVIGHCYLCKLGRKLQEPVEKDHTMVKIPWRSAEASMFLRYQAWAVRLGASKLFYQQENYTPSQTKNFETKKENVQ